MSFQLRPYQTGGLAAVRSALDEGTHRVLVALPTGTGKTVVMGYLPTTLGVRGRTLVLAQREELLDQAAARFRQVNPDLKVGIEQAGRRAATNCDVVIGSVQTLIAGSRSRLEALEPATFGFVVFDEAHHAVAPSYRAIFECICCFEHPARVPLVGFTATPTRGDGVGLGAVFEAIAFQRDLAGMIEQRWLCPIVGYRVRSQADLEAVRVRAGDFAQGQLAEAVDTDDRNALVVEGYQQLAASRTTVAFCASAAHAQRLSDAFADAGVPSVAVRGETPREDRRGALQALSNGDVRVVTNCNVLTEGFVEPRVGCILMARPTKSPLLYTQMVGRGTRLHDDKPDCVVVDIADNCRRYSLVSVGSLFELPETMDLAGRSATEVREQLDEIGQRFPWVDTRGLDSAADLQLVAFRQRSRVSRRTTGYRRRMRATGSPWPTARA